MNKPLVSILIPVFNREDFIEESIVSACKQTYQNIEIIVIDNASTDSTLNKIDVIAASNNKIRIVKNSINVGRVENWNVGLKNVQGEYFLFLMSDDILMPHAIETMVEQASKYENISIVSSGHKIIPDNNIYCRFNELVHMTGQDAYRSIINNGNWLAGLNNNLFSTQKMQLCGGFNTLLSWGSDWCFYLAMLGKGDLVYIPDALSIFRNHQGRLSDTGLIKSFYEDWLVRQMAFMPLYFNGEPYISLLRAKLDFSFLSISYLLEQRKKKGFSIGMTVSLLSELGRSIGYLFFVFAMMAYILKSNIRKILPESTVSFLKNKVWGKK